MNIKVAGIALLLLSPSALAQTADKSLGARINSAVGKVMAEGVTPGTEVGVMHDGQLIFAKGYGLANIELNIPVKTNTVFRIGSITKQFTAAAVLLLADERKLSVDDKLSKYFPDFPRGDQVSLRSMLNHTSGLHNYIDPKSGLDWHKDMSTAEMVAFIQGQSPLYDFEPGSKYSYSNAGYYLAGAIVEKISGQSLGAFLKERLFDKLGMSQTAIDAVQDIVPNRASGYDPIKGSKGEFYNTTYLSMTVPGGAGAMRSTVGDLAKWHYALFNNKVLSAASLKEMTTPGRTSDGQIINTRARASRTPLAGAESLASYSMGLNIGTYAGQPRIGHGGDIQGFNGAIETYPSAKTTIVVLDNSRGQAGKVLDAVAHAVFDK